MSILKVIFLAMAIFFTSLTLIKTCWKDDNGIMLFVLLQTIGIVGFLTLQFNLL